MDETMQVLMVEPYKDLGIFYEEVADDWYDDLDIHVVNDFAEVRSAVEEDSCNEMIDEDVEESLEDYFDAIAVARTPADSQRKINDGIEFLEELSQDYEVRNILTGVVSGYSIRSSLPERSLESVENQDFYIQKRDSIQDYLERLREEL